MAWIELFIAGIFEVVWSTCMKYSNGFTNLKFTIFTFAGMAVSFYFLAMAVKKLPMGTAYGVWTGVGALGAVAVGMASCSSRSPSPSRASSSSRCS